MTDADGELTICRPGAVESILCPAGGDGYAGASMNFVEKQKFSSAVSL